MASAFSLAGLGLPAIGRPVAHPPTGPSREAILQWRERRAETSRRRTCFANFRLLQLPRLRWVWLRWRRLPPRPGAVGMVAGTTVGAGVARASWSAARLIMPAVMTAATCGAWSEPLGVRAGGW